MAKAFIVDAVQRGYGVLVPERMVAWGDGQTIAWWQLNLETGEMVGVGEDGTHQFLLIGAFEALAFATLILEVYFLIEVLVLRCQVWRLAALWTWDYFWREAVGHVSPVTPSGGQKTLQQIYQEALEETKAYMRGPAWTAFYEAFGRECRELGVFPFNATCYLTW